MLWVCLIGTVCLRICICICIYIYMYVYMYVYIYIYMTYMHICICICVCTYICTFICIYIPMIHACVISALISRTRALLVKISPTVYVYTCICTCTCICICMCTRILRTFGKDHQRTAFLQRVTTCLHHLNNAGSIPATNFDVLIQSHVPPNERYAKIFDFRNPFEVPKKSEED